MCPAGGLGKNGPYVSKENISTLGPLVCLIILSTATRRAARHTDDVMREFSWPMAGQPTRSRHPRHSGLGTFCGKAAYIDLLLTFPRSLSSGGLRFLGFGVGLIFDCEPAAVGVPRDMHQAKTSQWHSRSLVEILKAIYTGEDFRPLLYYRG